MGGRGEHVTTIPAPMDKMELGRHLASGGLVHIEKHAQAAYWLINAFETPRRRKPKYVYLTLERHLAAIEAILPTVRRYLTDGVERPIVAQEAATGPDGKVHVCQAWDCPHVAAVAS